MTTEKIDPIKCPICGQAGFKNVEILIKHVDAHNKSDPEAQLSIKAIQKEYLSRLFG